MRRGGGSGDERAESNSKEHSGRAEAGAVRARAGESAADGGRVGGGVGVQNAVRYVRKPRGNVQPVRAAGRGAERVRGKMVHAFVRSLVKGEVLKEETKDKIKRCLAAMYREDEKAFTMIVQSLSPQENAFVYDLFSSLEN